MHHYKWSLDEIENMMVWEREIYINLLAEEKQKEIENKLNRQAMM